MPIDERYALRENWAGSDYELAMQVSSPPDDPALEAAIAALWTARELQEALAGTQCDGRNGGAAGQRGRGPDQETGVASWSGTAIRSGRWTRSRSPGIGGL
jgi:hypothetical protein